LLVVYVSVVCLALAEHIHLILALSDVLVVLLKTLHEELGEVLAWLRLGLVLHLLLVVALVVPSFLLGSVILLGALVHWSLLRLSAAAASWAHYGVYGSVTDRRSNTEGGSSGEHTSDSAAHASHAASGRLLWGCRLGSWCHSWLSSGCARLGCPAAEETTAAAGPR